MPAKVPGDRCLSSVIDEDKGGADGQDGGANVSEVKGRACVDRYSSSYHLVRGGGIAVHLADKVPVTLKVSTFFAVRMSPKVSSVKLGARIAHGPRRCCESGSRRRSTH